MVFVARINAQVVKISGTHFIPESNAELFAIGDMDLDTVVGIRHVGISGLCESCSLWPDASLAKLAVA